MPAKPTKSKPAAQTPDSPLAVYFPRVAVHSLLHVYTALWLPRTSWYFAPQPLPESSLDRPEPAYIRPLSASPALAVAWMCAGTFVLQAAWCGFVRARVFQERIPNPSPEVLAKWREGKKDAIRDAFMLTFAGTGAYTVLLVLFGAPLAIFHIRTVLLALLLSLLTVWTPVYALGISFKTTPSETLRTRLARIFYELSPRTLAERMLFFPVAGALLGAWAGAFPIALDWDRPWQAWPLTPALGAMAGYQLGALAALLPAPSLTHTKAE